MDCVTSICRGGFKLIPLIVGTGTCYRGVSILNCLQRRAKKKQLKKNQLALQKSLLVGGIINKFYCLKKSFVCNSSLAFCISTEQVTKTGDIQEME